MTISLTTNEAVKFLDSLNEPNQPNQRFLRAAKKYKAPPMPYQLLKLTEARW